MRPAIIDIGYNAVRAVVYESDSIGAPEMYNDKFRSDILSLLDLENLEINHQTYLVLKYLTHIFKRLRVSSVKCVATAVLRNHKRSEEFQKIVKEKFNIEIEIISGDREAYLTSLGLISGISNPEGVVADLGGGSLELASVKNREIDNIKSLPLGTKTIDLNHLNDFDLIKDIIKKEFGENVYPNLYLIGGAFRLIGRFYMEFVRYPLKNLHRLEIAKENFQIYLEKLKSLQKIKATYQDRRIENNAISVARAMIEVFDPDKVIISNYGLKEGVRFFYLPPEEKSKDIVYERVKFLVGFDEGLCDLAKYRAVVEKLLVEHDRVILGIVDFAIMFTQFNKNIDRTLRADFSVEFILASDIPFSHRERVALALALSCVYNSKGDKYINNLAKRTLTKSDYHNSQVIGNFVKIARDLDGPEFSEPSFDLILKGRYIEVTADGILPKALFTKICDRLKDIAFARKSVLDKAYNAES